MIERISIMRCDDRGCGEIFTVNSPVINDLKCRARDAGWLVGAHEHYCPSCRADLTPTYRCKCGHEFESAKSQEIVTCEICCRVGQVTVIGGNME